MPTVVECTCGNRVQVQDEHLGIAVRCPYCQGEIVVLSPAPQTPAQVQQAHAPPESTWYMQKENGQRFGPVSSQTLDAWFGEGRITAGDCIWREGDKQMRYAADVYPQLLGRSPEKTETNPPEQLSAVGLTTLRELGEKLLRPPARGAVTDYNLAGILHSISPNVSNAWTHVVEELAEYAENQQGRTQTGRDVDTEAYRKLEEKLHLVVVGLYADDVISHGASTEDCLIAVLRSLVSFKDVYPNWDDAYSVAHSVLVDGRNRIWNCLAAHQRVVEADMWPEQTEVDSRTCQPLEARVASFFGYAKICAAGSLGPCRELAPHLWEAISAGGPTPLSIEAKLFTWEFLHLVALSWWAARAASLEFAEVDARSVKRLLCHQLENWNPGTSKAFSDLDKFVLHADAYLRTLKDENEKLKVVQTSVGTWLLWNLTAKATFRDERRLAAMLGGTTYQFTGGYWNSAVDRASSAKSPPQRK